MKEKERRNPKVPPLQHPATYRIRIGGRLDASWSERLSDMTVTSTGGRDAAETTTLEGRVPDQAALTGVINTLADLRRPLISVECLDCSITPS